MKDDHQSDHLEVAVQTPDGTFYKVIPSMFLWTALPPKPGRSVLFFLNLQMGACTLASLLHTVYLNKADGRTICGDEQF